MDVSALDLGIIAAYYNTSCLFLAQAFLLLQAHFSRHQLPPDLAADEVLVLDQVLNLLSDCLDVMSSNA
jgi:Sec63 Brl domain